MKVKSLAKAFVVCDPKRKKFLWESPGNSEYDVDLIVDQINEATFFSSEEQARKQYLKPDGQRRPRSYYHSSPATAEEKKLSLFLQSCEVMAVRIVLDPS